MQHHDEPFLPLELLEHIIDTLAWELFEPASRAALYACTLVCKAFYNRASGHLISNVILGTGSKLHDNADAHIILHRQLEGLSDLLDARPFLASRVKALTIETWFGGVSPVEDRDLLLDNPHIPIIFPKLVSLSSFSWINNDKIFPWSSFSFPILEAFSNLLRTPTLASQTFECIESLPPSYLTRCTNLQRLRLVHVDPPEIEGIPSLHDSPPSQQNEIGPTTKLHTMVNRNASELVSRILSDGSEASSMFSRLRVLRMWMRKEDEVRVAWTVMQSASESLEELDIQDMSHFGYPTLIPGPVDIGILKNLHKIKINCIIASGDGVIVPQGISGLLSPPTTPSRVQNIEVTINWIDCRIGTEEDRSAPPRWRVLDEALSRRSTFPDLKSVLLTLKLGYGWSSTPGQPDPPTRIVAVKNHLLQLAGRLLPVTSRIPTVKTKISVLLYNSPYASNSAFY